ncbi:MAG: hypothetical protein ACLUUJ_08830 [Acutalibacteraceae bacterium]
MLLENIDFFDRCANCSRSAMEIPLSEYGGRQHPLRPLIAYLQRRAGLSPAAVPPAGGETA